MLPMLRPTTAASSGQPVCAAMACPAVSVSHETRFSLPSRCSTTTRMVSAIKSDFLLQFQKHSTAASGASRPDEALSSHRLFQHALPQRTFMVAEPEQEQGYNPGSHYPPEPEHGAAAETHPNPYPDQGIENNNLPPDGKQNGAKSLRIHGLVAAVFVALDKVAHSLLVPR